MSTINNGLPLVPENTTDPAAGLNITLNAIDMLLQLSVNSVGANTPPAGVEGQRHIVGTAPSGAWQGQASRVARFLNGAWQFRDAWLAVLIASPSVLYLRGPAGWAVYGGGGGSGGEANTASNVGNGHGIFKSKLGVDLAFRTLAAGANVTIAEDGDQLVITASGEGGGGTVVSPVVTESGTARTAGLADAGSYLRFTNAAAVGYTIPPQSSVSWAANTAIEIRRAGAGNLTLSPGAGVTLNAPSGGTLMLTDRMSVMLKRVSADVWDVVGQTVPA